MILDDLDLTVVIQDEVLKITSKEKADEILITRIYPVQDMLDKAGRRRITTGQLIDVFISTIQPDSWDERGAPGTITPLAGFLVVSQKFDCHEEIVDLLASLRAGLQREVVADIDGQVAEMEEFRVVLYPIFQISDEDAIKAVQTLVEPTAWNGQGGRGTACAVTRRLPRRTTRLIHRGSSVCSPCANPSICRCKSATCCTD